MSSILEPKSIVTLLFVENKLKACSHVVYSVRNVIDHYDLNASTVNVCIIDLTKAYDLMNHYVLFTK